MARKNAKGNVEHEDVVVEFNKLHFDPVNPRGVPEPDEEKIRAELAAQSETSVLAAHMAEHGQNPLDRIGIIDHPKLPGHYVIREGNRRLCAMQLLRDPMTYDDADEIRAMYMGLRQFRKTLTYYAQVKRSAAELLVLSDELVAPQALLEAQRQAA